MDASKQTDRESYSVSASSSHDDDDASDNLSESSLGTDIRPQSKTDEVKEVQRLSRWETLGIRFWRTVVLILLVIAGVLVSVGTYIFLSDAEKNDSTNRYFLFTHTISDSSAFHITNLHQAVRALGETVTTSSWTTNASFPNVTTPIFEVYGSHARQQSGVEAVMYAPLILESQVSRWNEYSVEHQGWLDESREILIDGTGSAGAFGTGPITPFIYVLDADGRITPVKGRGPFAPAWLSSPPPFDPAFVNYDLLGGQNLKALHPVVSLTRESVFSDVLDRADFIKSFVDVDQHAQLHQSYGANVTADTAFDRPHSILMQPVFRELNNDNSDIVGFLTSIVAWDRYLTNLLPEGVTGINCVLKNTCGQSYTYLLTGNTAVFVGRGDLHDPAFENTKVEIPLFDYQYPQRTPQVRGHCEYSLMVYSSSSYKQESQSNTPVIFTSIVAVTFFLVVVVFIVYDRFVQRRNTKVVDAAARSNAILSTLFPQNVRDRLFAEREDEAKQPKGQGPATKNRLRSFLDNDVTGMGANVPGSAEDLGYEGKPIADLFPETTILFADIAGFTAWSSVREPVQVFTLLETLYRAFDEIAKRRRIFKVETVGDCYVAVAGLPDPRKDHAVAMARFARDCMFRARALVKKLEVQLGPDTGELSMRMGLHSGPVTAGVLRGERSRFQLFGDTMNTASRMESTGERDKIQISQETADLLIASGKAEWLSLRESRVVAKGKGEMQTYWLSIGVNRADSGLDASRHSASDDDEDDDAPDEAAPAEMAAAVAVAQAQPDAKAYAMANNKTNRLIEWNVDVLLRLLKQIVARRKAAGLAEYGSALLESQTRFAEIGTTPIEEVKEIITLPKFNAKVASKQENPDAITLPSIVVDQLYDYVSNIAAIYNENPFHNFEHASHVTMSVVKLLSRIVAPTHIDYDDNLANTGKTLHDHTYGITSDPLTQFACVFSALIHDADHSGVPNVQLVQEKAHIAEFYKGKSVAEQNSVDLAWHLLMDEAYADLRHTIYSTEAELKRFRQLVVNSVMATDIVDKELKTLRNARWAKAFSDEAEKDESSSAVNRKATIVIEHLIQASDVAHTMQHWHIYRKWNERFFLECYKAYKDGRADKDPAETWYQGEMGFYDFYIIPLAKKLKDCGVFGVSSDEYLNYAIRNRKEWEDRGREIVDEMVEMVSKKGPSLEAAATPIKSPQKNSKAAQIA